MRSKLSKDSFVPGKPKKTRQGQGTHSKFTKHGRKKSRGQGK